MNLEKVAFNLENRCGVSSKSKVLVAVSGGVDSMVVAFSLTKLNYDISIAHINYGLRGEDSDADEVIVRAFAEKYHLPTFIHLAAEEMNEKGGQSIQMKAREIRYQFFNQILNQQSIPFLILAHHADDQLETILSNWVRGTAIDGLSGMKWRSDHILRPLLNIKKEEIYAFAKEQDIPFREDRSNSKNDYKRNRIRNQIIPKLVQENPNLHETVSNNLSILNEQVSVLNYWFIETKRRILKCDAFAAFVEIEKLNFTESPLLFLKYWLSPFGFTLSDIQSIHKALKLEHAKEWSAGQHTIYLSHGLLGLSEECNQEDYIWHINKDKEFITNNSVLKVSDQQPKGIAETFDFGILGQDLFVRTWLPGDKIQPLGMKGTKLVSDLLNEAKLPTWRKKRTLVLGRNEEIYWVVGLRLSEKAKITPQTTSKITLLYEPKIITRQSI